VLVPAHRCAIEAAVRDAEHERVLSALRAGADLVDDHRRLMLVEFVDDPDVNAQPVEPLVLRGHRSERRVLGWDRERGDLHVDQRLQVGRRLHHARRILVGDPRLFPGRRRGVDLGRRLAIGHQAIEPDTGRERSLPRALPALDVGVPESACPVRLVPAEDRADDERLIGFEHEGPAVLEDQDVGIEGDRSLGLGAVPQQPTFRAGLQVGQVPLTCEHDRAAGDDLPGHDAPRVGFDLVGLTRHS